MNARPSAPQPGSAANGVARELACPERIVLDDAPAALESMRGALAGGAVTLDLAPLVRFDSSAVAVLVALRRSAGSGLSFRNPPANLRTLASLYGVDTLLFGA